MSTILQVPQGANDDVAVWPNDVGDSGGPVVLKVGETRMFVSTMRPSSLFSGSNTGQTSIFSFDLKGAFAAAMLEWIDAGWQLAEFSCRSVHFFCTKIVELRAVQISPTDPGIEYLRCPFIL